MTSHDGSSRAAAVAALVTDLAAKGVPVRGRKAMQKLLFFAQDLGWPTTFSFRLHFFGPYSEQADAVVNLLEADNVIRRNVQGELVPSENAGAVSGALARTPQAKKAIGRLANLFGQDDPMTLELLATIKYMWDAEFFLYRRVTPATVVKRVSRYKGPKFSEQQIKNGVQRLKRAHLLN